MFTLQFADSDNELKIELNTATAVVVVRLPYGNTGQGLSVYAYTEVCKELHLVLYGHFLLHHHAMSSLLSLVSALLFDNSLLPLQLES
jgi:hypothetical protein